MYGMAWVSRGGRRYFYQVVREGGKIRHRYLGHGPVAQDAAAEIERRRKQRAADAQTAKENERRYAEATGALDELCRSTDLLLQAALLGLGYHQHDRTWRKRRGFALAPRPHPHPADQPGRTASDSGPRPCG